MSNFMMQLPQMPSIVQNNMTTQRPDTSNAKVQKDSFRDAMKKVTAKDAQNPAKPDGPAQNPKADNNTEEQPIAEEQNAAAALVDPSMLINFEVPLENQTQIQTSGSLPVTESAAILNLDSDASQQASASKTQDLLNANPEKAPTQELPQTKTMDMALPKEQAQQSKPSDGQQMQVTQNIATETSVSKTADQPIATENFADSKTTDQDQLPETNPHTSLVKNQQNEPETIFVKVGENTAPAEPKQLTSQISEKIMLHSADGRQEFDIQLSPKELGQIHIKMAFENGRASIVLQCSNAQTQQLLSSNMGHIRDIVEAGTGMRTDVTVKSENENHQPQDSKQENQAREEQKERQREQSKRSADLEVSAFVQRFRLGLMTS